MPEETGYQDKFILIKPWLAEIIKVVKKDLKNEHLKIDREFCKRYFMGKNILQIQPEEMAPAYEKDIAEGNVGLGEFIASRWLLKCTDLYDYFESKLSAIRPDFEELDALSYEESHPIVEGASKEFGAQNTYIFSIFNSVVFPDEILEKLRKKALVETEELEELQLQNQEAETMEKMQKRHERESSALKDRFEKKLSGLQKKYLRDVASLKKQIAGLHEK